ncbi:MAG: hypothetical protein O9972_36005 [Burkholderiales bacterium]|nr:hypothetical protein [Burkholderiales bacterium]
MRYILFKALPASEPEKGKEDTDIVVESARASYEEQVKRAKTPQDRERAEQTLLLFLKKHGTKGRPGA